MSTESPKSNSDKNRQFFMQIAAWLVDNTGLTFNQIAECCGLRIEEIQSIADEEIDIEKYNPLISGIITEKEIDDCKRDPKQIPNLITKNIKKRSKLVLGAPLAARRKFFSNGDLYVHLSAILAVLGHMFPIWLKFKGGKGVATTLGVLMALDTNIALIFIFTWVTVFFIFRYSSLASLSAVAVITTTSFFCQRNLFLALLVIGTLVFLKHYKNITNLIKGGEYKFHK